MLRYPIMKHAEAILRHLQRQSGAELRLSARSLEEDHEVPRNRERNTASQILLNEGQRQIDPGGHPR